MAMNQPVPPENQPQVAPEQVPAPTPPVDQTPVPTPTPEVAPTDQTLAAPAQEEQVIEQVAEGLADDQITAEDIMVAVLSDSLGLSPSGAQSLFQLLMSDLAEDTASEETSTEQPPME